MSRQNLEAFTRAFLQNTSLQEQLRDITDKAQFIQRAVELGREQGYEFTVEEVEEALVEKAVTDVHEGLNRNNPEVAPRSITPQPQVY